MHTYILCFFMIASCISYCQNKTDNRPQAWQQKNTALICPAKDDSNCITKSIHDNVQRIVEWQKNGVQFVRPDFVVIDPDVHIGKGSIIGCGAHILNGSMIGNNCIVGPFCIIDKTIIEDDVTIYAHCVLEDTMIKRRAKVGPFAHTRNKSVIEKAAEIGNFVEMSNSIIGERSKAKHLTYLGCAIIEEEVNIGGGVITCNYDGFGKHTTLFKRKSFIGSNGTFVAPLTVGEGAITAAGSTFTHNVPDGALGIGRARQSIKEDYAEKLKLKFQNRLKK